MKLSIITINFNNRNGLEKTIESVVNQTYKDFEYIVIDGGSTDGGVDVIKQHSNKIDYWISEPDKGIYHAMNKGIDAAKGEYCIFMNSGDTFCQNNTIESIFTQEMDKDIICGNTMMPERVYPPKEITFQTLYSECICHQCAFIKSNLMRKHKYDEKLRIVADRKFFIQALILDNCTYTWIDVDVANYDINGFSSQNRFYSEHEYQIVLEELIPKRIRDDYGKKQWGELYGDGYYEKLFMEIRKRKYKKLIYTATYTILRILSMFKSSASFIKHFPQHL